MAKNIKTFDGTNKAECITRLSQAESAAKIAGISLKRNGLRFSFTSNTSSISQATNHSLRPRHQEHNPSKLFRSVEHHRGYSQTTQNADATQQTINNFQF